MSVISSVGTSDEEILTNILRLHVGQTYFDVDPCYSKGNFWKNMPVPPILCYDLSPQFDFVEQADCRHLPLADCQVKSLVFDPPFMFGTHGQTKNNAMNKRFTMFDTWEELEEMYKSSLAEFYRVLDTGGILAFKCQDYTDSKTTMTHCHVWEWARGAGYYAKDLFILAWQGGRIYNPKLVQRHARKFHSYYWVFQK